MGLLEQHAVLEDAAGEDHEVSCFALGLASTGLGRRPREGRVETGIPSSGEPRSRSWRIARTVSRGSRMRVPRRRFLARLDQRQRVGRSLRMIADASSSAAACPS